MQRWLQRHQRFQLHFASTSSAWLHLVERCFREIPDKCIRRGVFGSVRELIAAVAGYIAQHKRAPQSVTWTAMAGTILEKVRRVRAALDKMQTA